MVSPGREICLTIFRCLDTIHECDRQTDRQMDEHQSSFAESAALIIIIVIFSTIRVVILDSIATNIPEIYRLVYSAYSC